MKSWVVVVGGTNMDVVARTSAPLVAATSNPGHTRISPGGVGRNVAACLGLLGAPVRLVSAVGEDAFGDEALRVTAACGADVSAVRRVPGAATGTYTAVLDSHGELVAAVSDMAIIDAFELDTLHLDDAALVVVDGNLAPAQVAKVRAAAAAAGVPIAFEPVSVAKADRLHGEVAGPLPGDPQLRRDRRAGRAAGTTRGPPSTTSTTAASSTSGCARASAAPTSAVSAADPCTSPPSQSTSSTSPARAMRCSRAGSPRGCAAPIRWTRRARDIAPQPRRHERPHRPPRPGRGHGRLRTPDSERGHRC